MAISSDLEVTSEEFYLYDANAIISSVGGGLGMFLGCSCLGLILEILKILVNHSNWVFCPDLKAQPGRCPKAKMPRKKAKARF